MGRAKASALTIPWATYTSPEIAHVGLSERDAQQQNVPIDTFTQELADVDRAILEGETDGFVKIHVQKGTDKIVGATIVAANAGDMISEVTLAMAANARVSGWLKRLRLAPTIGLKVVGGTIHPYPTQAEAIRKTGDLYSRTRLTPLVKSMFNWWLARTR
jgi:pyruvate/2-oxoglutarate dehydrogenase complex dihydrolipoamide dehydrogenase (E3) component